MASVALPPSTEHSNAAEIPTFDAVITAHAARIPQHPAVKCGEAVWSYQALDAITNRIANGLIARGAAIGDRIAYHGANSDLIPILLIAAAKAGLIFAPINWRLAPREIDAILADIEPVLLVADRDPVAGSSYPVIGCDAAIGSFADSPSHSPGRAAPAGDPILMLYTSGTTGDPKGVLLSCNTLFGRSVYQDMLEDRWDSWSGDDVCLIPIPLAHSGGMAMMVRTLYYGGTAIIHPAFDAAAVAAAVIADGVTILALVPTTIRKLLDHPDAARIRHGQVRSLYYGGAPIGEDLLTAVIDRLGARFLQSYGMTEIGGTATILSPAHHLAGKPGLLRSAGKPMNGAVIRIARADGSTCAPGEIGEVRVLIHTIMAGYWRKPGETRAAFDADGYYRTGDLGYFDEDGFLFLCDRLKDMIVTGGENVFSVEVEKAIQSHPAVEAVGVIGVADPIWGEAVTAVVVPKPGEMLDAETLLPWLRERIAGFKIPKTIHFVDALECTPSGKVKKAALRARYASKGD